MALLIGTDNTVTPIRLDGRSPYDVAREHIDEMCSQSAIFKDGNGTSVYLIYDDNGLAKKLPVNMIATIMYNRGEPEPDYYGVVYPVVGDVLLTTVEHPGTDKETWY